MKIHIIKIQMQIFISLFIYLRCIHSLTLTQPLTRLNSYSVPMIKTIRLNNGESKEDTGIVIYQTPLLNLNSIRHIPFFSYLREQPYKQSLP